MSVHTPGPWKVEAGLVNNQIPITAHPGHKVYVAHVAIAKLVDAEANARLIAAAPDMLETLRSAMDWLRDGGVPADYPYDTLLAVLAKIEGKS